MKIVNVEDYFIPDAGYQINILPKYLAQFGHEVYIVTSRPEGIKKHAADFFGTENIEERDQHWTQQTGVKIIRLAPFTKKIISGRMIQSNELLKTVIGLKPDVVFVHGNDSLTGIRFILRKRHFALVTDSHMLAMATQNKLNTLFYWLYRKLITTRIITQRIPVIRTQDDSFVEKNLGIPLSLAPWISYGSDTMLFHPDSSVKKAFRKENGISDNAFVVLYAGKLDEAKGGYFLADSIQDRFNSYSEVVFIIVGNTSGEYGKKVEEKLANSKNRVIRYPTQKYPDLPAFFQSSDLAVFPRQCSLSFYDAQACGLPVLLENNNINLDRCKYENGWTFQSDSKEDFRKKLNDIINLMPEKFHSVSMNAVRFISDNYNYENKAREYEEFLKAEFERNIVGQERVSLKK